MDKDGEHWVVDEKAATSRKDAYDSLKTFCFEISAKVNKDGLGWLYQKDNETTHYALIYPSSTDGFETLDKVEILIIPKRKIVEMLFDAGIAGPKDASEMLEGGRFDSLGRQYCRINDCIKLMTSYQLAEEPTNALIDRGVLRRLAVAKIKEGE